MSRLLPALLGTFSLVTLILLYLASTDIPRSLSPQGCRMSWMSPSYILQSEFNTSWTPLANRYSLWLYREVGWEANQVSGVPVLFIPGNAGSSHQVRSIASSATRQYYASPYIKASEFEGRALKPPDFFAVEFNEDLSAFHGPTLDSEIAYSSRAISYIMSLYPPNTSIIVMGHSMGGIVATSLLPSENISTIITMSTPHTLPPARFDARIDRIYDAHHYNFLSDPTPILSLCGGATDMMIPSESCILPDTQLTSLSDDVYRRTVFTFALEGAWTGVGHREMVWCHQVRWRVARAALELGAAQSTTERAVVLDRWLRDGNRLPPAEDSLPRRISLTDSSTYTVLAPNIHLDLRNPHGSRTYLLPVPNASTAEGQKFVLYVSRGSIPPVSPHHTIPLHISIYICSRDGIITDPINASQRNCTPLSPSIHKLLPSPIPGKSFPVPDEGSDESEGVVFYEATIPSHWNTQDIWLGVQVEEGDGRGWIVGGFVAGEGTVSNEAGIMSPVLGHVSVKLPASDPDAALRTQIFLPNLLSSALIVYRLTPEMVSQSCSDPLLAPLLMHTSQASESHYFPLTESRSIHLHSHSSAPYIPTLRPVLSRGLNLTIYATGCGVSELHITVDWWATVGRWGTRYATAMASWVVGVVALVVFGAWRVADEGGPVPSVGVSLSRFASDVLPKLLLGSFVVSLIPLPASYYLGNGGEPLFAPIASLILVTVTGLVYISWLVLLILMWPLQKLSRAMSRRRREDLSVRRGAFVSMSLIFLLIFLFVPWQVAFFGCWLIHLYTCATSGPSKAFPGSSPTPNTTPTGTAIPLLRAGEQDSDASSEQNRDLKDGERRFMRPYESDNFHHNMHILLLMTWLLPLVIPVLAVWVRTLATAGLTTPFDGDHNFLNVAPFLVVVDFASWNAGPLFEKQRWESFISVRWVLVVLAFVAFFFGPRGAYKAFDAANVVVALIFVTRVGRRYLGGVSFFPSDSRDRRNG